MALLDGQATVARTARGDIPLAREGIGPPVVVAHGGPGGFDLGRAWSHHLGASGCEVLAVSRPGYLRTPIEAGRSVGRQADLHAALLDELRIERAAILGFSSGAPSAVQFAARHPQRTTALLLDAAVLLPFEVPIRALQRAIYESSGVLSGWPIRRRREVPNWRRGSPSADGDRLDHIGPDPSPAHATAVDLHRAEAEPSGWVDQ